MRNRVFFRSSFGSFPTCRTFLPLGPFGVRLELEILNLYVAAPTRTRLLDSDTRTSGDVRQWQDKESTNAGLLRYGDCNIDYCGSLRRACAHIHMHGTFSFCDRWCIPVASEGEGEGEYIRAGEYLFPGTTNGEIVRIVEGR